jgi:hypothetical protein
VVVVEGPLVGSHFHRHCTPHQEKGGIFKLRIYCKATVRLGCLFVFFIPVVPMLMLEREQVLEQKAAKAQASEKDFLSVDVDGYPSFEAYHKMTWAQRGAFEDHEKKRR